MDFYRNVLCLELYLHIIKESVLLKIQLMGGSHSESIKIATVNYSGITDSPFEFESNDTPELAQLNKIFRVLFHQLIEALDKDLKTIPELKSIEQVQQKEQQQEAKMSQSKKNSENNKWQKHVWKRFTQLGKAKDEQIKKFMENLNKQEGAKAIRQRNSDPDTQIRKLKSFNWNISHLDKNMHKGRYCPQYRENIGMQNGRFISMNAFFLRWKFEFEKNKAYSNLKSKSARIQKNVCMVYDYLVYKTLVEYSYDDYLKVCEKLPQNNFKKYTENKGYSIAPRDILQNGQRKNQIKEQKPLRRNIVRKYEQLMQKYHSMPYLKHQKKYLALKEVVKQNHIIFLQDISDQLLNALKGEGDLTIADRLGSKDDCCIVINNKSQKFVNLYDSLKITDKTKRKNNQKQQANIEPQLLTIDDFNYYFQQKKKAQKQYVPAVCFVDNFLILSLRFTSKEQRAIQIYKFFDHMIKVNKKYPSLFIIIGGDFNCDLTNQNQLKQLAKDDKIKKMFSQEQLLAKYQQFKQYFDISQTGDTTIKKRSWLQSQSHKAGKQDKSQRDFLISNHPFLNYKRDGPIINEKTILPSKQHPFDHFFILGELNKNSPKFKKNQNQPNP